MENKIEFRKAVINDLESLTLLRIKMLCEDNNYNMDFIEKIKLYTNEYFNRELVDENYVSWVALSEYKIVGMCGITFFKIPPNDWCLAGNTGYIGNMYTEKEFRRNGIAKNLLKKIIEEAKIRNCERIILDTTEMGEKIYIKYGFEYSRTKMVYYPSGKEYEKWNIN
jgi:GNAT superfamily N-acetyltransferase